MPAPTALNPEPETPADDTWHALDADAALARCDVHAGTGLTTHEVLPAHALVPGDILLLTAGDAVAADARLLEQAQLQVAEAALTGESLPVQKSTAALPASTELADRCNMLYSGTQVSAGRARALVVAFATPDDGPLNPQDGFEALAGRLRLLGLVGQIDPPRDEVKAAVAACRQAGIRPVMVTGDHPLTGLAIATELGIALPGDLAISGAELQAMDEPSLMASLPRVSVFARVQPAQKLRIVMALQASGEVVAMTGDGVNDAPAMARADVGVAMGITGTEVAKGAARIVITDDNFATIVAAVEQGRVVYGNVRKLILYLLATSLAEVLLMLLASSVLWAEALRKFLVRRQRAPGA